jgi:hypothetical protein
MGQLTGGIAHDFANLLTVVSMNLEMIARHPGDAARNAQAAAGAARTVARAKTLIARLLAFAKQQPLELKAVDLNALVAEAHPLVAQAAGPGIELVLQLAPALPLARTDESQFEMALLNLVVNARDAMGKRGRIVLRTFADARSGAPCLDVDDDGPGMDAQTRRRAMEPLFTTKTTAPGSACRRCTASCPRRAAASRSSARRAAAPGCGSASRARASLLPRRQAIDPLPVARRRRIPDRLSGGRRCAPARELRPDGAELGKDMHPGGRPS